MSSSIFGFLFDNLKYETISEYEYFTEVIDNDLEGLDPKDEVCENSFQNKETLSNEENDLSVQSDYEGKRRKAISNDFVVMDPLDEESENLAINEIKDSNVHDNSKIRTDKTTNLHYCSLCSFSNSRRSHVIRHYDGVHSKMAGYIKCPKCGIKLHSNELGRHSCMFYPCDLCGKEFNSLSYLANHKRGQHSDLGTFDCHLCGKIYKSKKHLKKHESDAHCERIPCQICKKEVRSVYYKSHLKAHDEKTACDICNKVVKDLDNHKLKYHNYNEGKPLHNVKIRTDETTNMHHCSLCSFSNTRRSQVLRHYNGVHSKALGYIKCPKCGIKMPPSDLESHSCVFYPCDICGKEFNSIHYVANHKRNQHTGLGSFSCQLCGKLCKSKYTLKKHYHDVHGEKIPCHVCGEEVRAVNYKAHLRAHEEKAICDICNKEVRNLKFHKLNKHTNDEEKPFQCSECGKRFILACHLQEHTKQIHLNLKQYKCRYGCSFASSYSCHRNRHEKKSHGSIFQKNGLCHKDSK